MTQGINKEYIFETQKDKEKYLKLIYCNDEGIEVIAYCIMDNHTHILVQVENIQNLQNWMKKTNTSYAIYFNKRNDRVGYVFRERYKVQPIKNERHLYLGIEYIHNNPIKAGICKKKEEYEFSSYRTIYNGNQREIQKRLEKIEKQSVWQDENQDKEEKFELLEDEKENKEEMCQVVIDDFLQNKRLTLEKLKKEEKELIEIIKILKYDNNISYRLMAKYLEINREKLRRVIANAI